MSHSNPSLSATVPSRYRLNSIKFNSRTQPKELLLLKPPRRNQRISNLRSKLLDLRECGTANLKWSILPVNLRIPANSNLRNRSRKNGRWKRKWKSKRLGRNFSSLSQLMTLTQDFIVILSPHSLKSRNLSYKFLKKRMLFAKPKKQKN